MSDISAIFGTLLTLGIVFPGWLTAFWLLFPASVERARARLDATPWRCFWLGGAVLAALVIPVLILLALPFGPAKFLGYVLIASALSLSSIGAAGLASKMGQTLSKAAPSLSSAAGFVRGAVALELAAAMPFVGWLVFMPLAIVLSLGASAFSILNWNTKRAPAHEPVSA